MPPRPMPRPRTKRAALPDPPRHVFPDVLFSGLIAALVLDQAQQTEEARRMRQRSILTAMAANSPAHAVLLSSPSLREGFERLSREEFSSILNEYLRSLPSSEECYKFFAEAARTTEPKYFNRERAVSRVSKVLLFDDLVDALVGRQAPPHAELKKLDIPFLYPFLFTQTATIPLTRSHPLPAKLRSSSDLLSPDEVKLGSYRDKLEKLAGITPTEELTLGIEALSSRLKEAVFYASPEQSDQLIDEACELAGPAALQAERAEAEAFVKELLEPNFTGFSSLSLPTIKPSEPQHHEPPQMAKQEAPVTVAKDGTLLKGGVRYHSLSAAASLAQVHRTTLLRWIKDPDTKVQGQSLESYYFAPLDTYFISENSIQRLANRFLKWPSEEPAGPVTLSETKDKSGFLGMFEAADILGVSRRTMWLWMSQGKAPTDKPPDVIKDSISKHFYIRQKDAYELKKLIPKRGLQRGRRPQLALQP